ncbi:hypothetical protein O6H91_Y541400 [Diphasiastrum complanatum]|nr:hypothetical protein O6H91_Y541400 [Diphasiastrum complanatum]
MAKAKFVLFGDSITQQSFLPAGGWGAALADRYARKADIILRGLSGYNSRWALFLLDRIFPTAALNPPVLVTVFFGANDAALPDRKSKAQHVPLSEYKENLQRIVSHLKGLSPSTRVVLITPPPIDVRGRQAYARATYGDSAEELPERTNEAAGEYAQACKAAAKEAEVPIIDLYSIFQQNPNWQELYLW